MLTWDTAGTALCKPAIFSKLHSLHLFPWTQVRGTSEAGYLNSAVYAFQEVAKALKAQDFFPIPSSTFQHSEHLGRAADHCAVGKPCEKSAYVKQVCKQLLMQSTLSLSCPTVKKRYVLVLTLLLQSKHLGNYLWAHSALSSPYTS